MTESESPAFSWVCPQCTRRVPRKLTQCRCGYKPNDLADTAPTVLAAAVGDQRATTIAAAAAVAIAAVAGVWYGMHLRRPAEQPAPMTMTAGTPSFPLRARAVEQPRPLAPQPDPIRPVSKEVPAPAVAKVPPVVPTGAASASTSLEDLVSRLLPAVVTVQTSLARGSGFFVAADTILTNVHVVGSEAGVTIRRSNGAWTNARVDSTSAAYDIAVLKVERPLASQPTIPMGSATTARVGQEVIAIGTPLGFLENTVSRGIVSALRDVEGATVVQTDAAINPGNSGGPLLDRNGVAIGIIKSGYQGRDGLSFAVAIDHARAVLEGRPAPVFAATASPSPYKPLDPAVASPAEQHRAEGAAAFDKAIAQLARLASALDDNWQAFKGSCYGGRVAGTFDHEWFALWDQHAMQGAVAPGCGPWFNDIRRKAQDIRDGVLAADEAARQADVYPGARRDLLRRYGLDYAGWGR
jgi:S1-C subfamily serine protease